MELIGLTGYKGTGKDTVAGHLTAHFDFYRLAFADPLKDLTARLLQIPLDVLHSSLKDQPLTGLEARFDLAFRTPREVMQKLGTEIIRAHLGSDVWVWHLDRRVRGLPRVVVPDVRFPNEARWIRRHGTLWHVLRPGTGPDGHASEKGLRPRPREPILINDGTPEDLEHAVLAHYHRISRPLCARSG